MARLVFCLALLVGLPASAEERAKDEEGIWMIVDKQERFIRTSPVRIEDEGLQTYLNGLMCRVADSDCESIRIYALRLPGFNAFMMPNGGMFIQSGLLLRVESEAELASVIGHELAHYQEKHSIANIRRWRKTNNAFAVLGALVGAAGTVSVNTAGSYESAARSLDLTNTGLAMLQTAQIFASFQLVAYSRDDEREADIRGMNLIVDSGFQPEASANVWRNYLAEHHAAKEEYGFSMLATHPSPAQRLSYLDELAASAQHDNPPTPEDDNLMPIVDRFRVQWLEAEAQALFPGQFEALIEHQLAFTNIDPGYAVYLQAKAWERYAGLRQLAESKREKALASALEHYRTGALMEAGMPTEAYRDWGKLSRKLGDNTEAKSALSTYLELAPDAWDAKFIKREMSRL